MSKYHSNCCPNINDYRKQQSKARAGPPLTSKPFCDCETCTCKDCPDILKLLCITVTENSCDFGSKEVEGTNDGISDHVLEHQQRVLDVMSKSSDCGCEVMARAVRSNVHMNVGMTERRTEINENSSTTKDTPPQK